MRAGKLTTKRYKVGRRGGGWLLLLMGAVLGAGLMGLVRGQGTLSLPIRFPFASQTPDATRTPQDLAAAEMTVTLPGRAWYALQLGVFQEEASATALAETYRSRGAAGYVLKQDGFRVLAAAYGTRAGAQTVMSKLKSAHQVDTVITPLSQPEITLRLSGRQAQLTALRDAYDALTALPEHLSALAEGLDRGETTGETALSALRSQRDTLSALSARLGALFGENAPDAVKGAETLLSDLTRSLDEALSAQGKTALGAGVRYALLQCLCGTIAYADALVP